MTRKQQGRVTLLPQLNGKTLSKQVEYPSVRNFESICKMGNAQLKDIDDGDEDFVDELKPGTELMHGQYVIEKFLNAGGFGITYLAKDSLDRKIVIKECFPGAFCRRSKAIVQARSRAHQPELKSIVRLFVQEARSLSKLTHPNIVGVHQVFEDNDTAYMALDFVEGRDLLDTLEDGDHGLNPAQIKSILTDLLGAVGFVHDQNMLHRDISPDNILIDGNLRPVLIDFGAAREQATKQSRVLSALRVVKDGYSPQEFYIAGSAQDASSDLYALGATFYHLISGETPPNSQARLAAIASGEKDPYVPLVDRVKGYDRDFLASLDMSLRVLPQDRVQSAQDWLDMMNGKTPIVAKVTPVAAAANANKPKTRTPMLMASVAVVALLGVVIVTQTDILTKLEADPTASVTEEPVSATETATVAPLIEQPTLVEEPTIVETPVAETPVVEEPIVEAEPLELVEAVNVPPFDETAAPDVPTPVVAEVSTRPVLRPEDLGVAPLPTPLPTPEIILDAVATPVLPGFLTKLEDIPASATPVLALPESPVEVEAEAVAIALDIPALVPGNEVAPTVASAVVEEPYFEVPEVVAQDAPAPVTTPSDKILVLSAWSVDLPFTASETQADTVGATESGAPSWMREGVVVKSVNGTPVAAISDIPSILRDKIAPGDAAEVNVTFAVEENGIESNYDLSMPIHQDFQLLNGMTFTASNVDGSWLTKVTNVPSGVETELAVGDELVAFIPTSKRIETRTGLKDLFDTEVAAGTSQFSFAVNRENSMWVVGLEYNPNPEND